MLSGKRQVDFGLARDTPCRAFKQNFPRRWWGLDQRPQELPNRTARPVDVFDAVQCGCSSIASRRVTPPSLESSLSSISVPDSSK